MSMYQDLLANFSSLLRDGLITQAQYDEKKREVERRMQAGAQPRPAAQPLPQQQPQQQQYQQYQQPQQQQQQQQQQQPGVATMGRNTSNAIMQHQQQQYQQQPQQHQQYQQSPQQQPLQYQQQQPPLQYQQQQPLQYQQSPLQYQQQQPLQFQQQQPHELLSTLMYAGDLSGHTHYVLGMARLGNTIFSAGQDLSIKTWQDNRNTHTLEGAHSLPISKLCSSSPDSAHNAQLLSASWDTKIKVWDVGDGSLREVRALRSHSGYVSALMTHNHLIYSGSWDAEIIIWDERAFRPVETINNTLGTSDQGSSVFCLTTDSSYLYSGASDSLIKSWGLSGGRYYHSTLGESPRTHHTNWVMDMCFHGSLLFSASRDCTIKVWDMSILKLKGQADQRMVHELIGHTQPVTSLVVVPQSNLLLSADGGGCIKAWQLDTYACIETKQAHSDWIYSLLLTASGDTLYSASRDRCIKCFTLP